MSEPPEEDSPVDNTEGDHLSQAIGKDQHGHVRTYGLGPRQSDIWGSTSANMEERMTTSEVFTNDRTKELTMKLEVVEKNYAMLEKNYAVMEKNYAVMEAKFDKCSNLLERVLSTLCPGQTSLVEDDIAIAPNQASTKPYATAKSFKPHGSNSSSSHGPKSSKRCKTKKA